MASPRFPVVLFDLDGTIVDEKSSWEWVHDHFGVDNADNVRAYLDGHLDDLAFMAADIALWQEVVGGPIHINEVADVLRDAPLMRGAQALFEALHDAGVGTAIVSGGIDLLADHVAKEMGCAFAISNSLVTNPDGTLTGEGLCRVYLENKASPSREALKRLGAAPGEAAAVGNSRYDVGMFEVAGTGIAFAPLDDEVRAGADLVVDSRDMRDLLPVLLGVQA